MRRLRAVPAVLLRAVGAHPVGLMRPIPSNTPHRDIMIIECSKANVAGGTRRIKNSGGVYLFTLYRPPTFRIEAKLSASIRSGGECWLLRRNCCGRVVD